MKVRTLLLVVAVLGGVAFGYSRRAELELRICRLEFPAGWQPRPGWGSNNHSVRGIFGSTRWLDKLVLDDGTAVSHWFVSHHDADDLGSVLFEFPGGQTLLVNGWRCCGIEIEDTMRPLNKETFVHAIKNYNALAPLWRRPG